MPNETEIDICINHDIYEFTFKNNDHEKCDFFIGTLISLILIILVILVKGLIF